MPSRSSPSHKSNHPPNLRAVYATNALSWGGAERLELERILERFGTEIWDRTILQEMRRQGVDLTPAAIRDAQRAWALERRTAVAELSKWSAASIVRTHNRLIAAASERLLEQNPAINRYAFARAIARVEDAVSEWKWRQVNETARFAFYQDAFESFYQSNPELATLFDFGGSLQCPICQEIADANPYTLAGMAEVEDPPHVGCLDVWTPVN